ncbi:MAG TPA: hypothetical protein VMU94_10540 [Streptosporangiaceae bacterium]|nr:hypothetical protein [Streptosporangiaceae bacterium]
MVGAAAGEDLGAALVGRHGLPVGPGGHQAAQQVGGVLGVAQVACAVKRMEPGAGQGRCVSDLV